MDVLVIAGTADGRQIVESLVAENVKVIATVTTEFGKNLINNSKDLEIHTGRLNCNEMINLIKSLQIRCVVDASHPYAKNVSENAVNACNNTYIPYIRYERDEVLSNEVKTIRVNSFEEAACEADLIEGNIFLTVGSNNIDIFTERINNFANRLFARVLPDSKVIERCENAGLNANNIIAIKGPFSEEINIEMMKHCKASVLVTKNSGDAGGTNEKLLAAGKMNIPVILVERPKVDYPVKASTISEIISFVREVIK